MVFQITKCFKIPLRDDNEGARYAFTDGQTAFPVMLVCVTYDHGVNRISDYSKYDLQDQVSIPSTGVSKLSLFLSSPGSIFDILN